MARDTGGRAPGGATAYNGPSWRRPPTRLEIAGFLVAVVAAGIAIATFVYPGGFIHGNNPDGRSVVTAPISRPNVPATEVPTLPPSASSPLPSPPAAATQSLGHFSAA